jgi:ribosome maturation factor RimP
MTGSSNAIRELVEPALASSGLELWDVEVSRDLVRVLVDRPGGIDLDSLATVAGRVVSPLLDEHPELTPQGRFQLEVSSPGVERTLRRLDQYQRYLGTEVSVKTSVPVAGARRHHGKLVAADESGIQIEPKDGPPGTVVELPYSQIDRARTVLVWGPAEPNRAQSRSGPKGSKSRAAKRPVAPDQTERPVASNDLKDTAP